MNKNRKKKTSTGQIRRKRMTEVFVRQSVHSVSQGKGQNDEAGFWRLLDGSRVSPVWLCSTGTTVTRRQPFWRVLLQCEEGPLQTEMAKTSRGQSSQDEANEAAGTRPARLLSGTTLEIRPRLPKQGAGRLVDAGS